MLSDVSRFYSNLATWTGSASELFASSNNFSPLPPSWHVIVTDIVGSTAWVDDGEHHAVNLIATGSIIAALNIAHVQGTEIPFFFGGDGATILVPENLLVHVLDALHAHRTNTRRSFAMVLRVGAVRHSELMQRGATIHIAKMQRTAAFSIPVCLGDGIPVAERMVKSASDPEFSDNTIDHLDMSGMECRWDRIKPPPRQQEVVCLLVNALQSEEQRTLIKRVLDAIERSYGSRRARNPISAARLRLDAAPRNLAREMRAKLGALNWRYFLEHWVRTAIIGPAFLRFADAGRTYVQRTPELSDTLVIDGRVNTIISGAAKNRATLQASLEAMEREGVIAFGIHVSPASIMSCYVRNRDDAHIHFVDGDDGGYTQAAKMLKRKLAERRGDQASRIE